MPWGRQSSHLFRIYFFYTQYYALHTLIFRGNIFPFSFPIFCCSWKLIGNYSYACPQKLVEFWLSKLYVVANPSNNNKIFSSLSHFSSFLFFFFQQLVTNSELKFVLFPRWLTKSRRKQRAEQVYDLLYFMLC